MFQPTLVAYDTDGSRVLEIRCEVARLLRDEHTYEIDGLTRATLFRDDKPVLAMRADRGRYNDASKDALLEGGVRVASEDGFLLETDRVLWTYRVRQVSSPGPLRLKFGELMASVPNAVYAVREQRLDAPIPSTAANVTALPLVRAQTEVTPRFTPKVAPKAAGKSGPFAPGQTPSALAGGGKVTAVTSGDRLSADRLYIEGKRKVLTLSGNVALSAEEGVSLRTPEVVYDYPARRALLPQQVTVQYRGLVAQGRGVEYLAGDRLLRCLNPVSARLGTDSLSAKSLVVDGVRRRLRLSGEVVLRFIPEGAEQRLSALQPRKGRRVR